MSTTLDPIDQELVRALCVDGRASYQELGKTIGLSPTATADRVRRLVRTGVIRGFRAVVDAEHVGRTVEAAIDVRLELGTDRDEFVAVLRAHPAVIEAVHVTGHFDYQLRVFCSGTAELDAVLGSLKSNGIVVETATRVMLHRIPGLDPLGLSLDTGPDVVAGRPEVPGWG
ncbi:Lrp/AsnC family transcriptional regulator [Aquihabitans daechungensis]|uniref:Lrp/AsnC family transcriptional regulator n=1 Tax=Aquihabitans daechungensis TaxID=1052257 RepID=UPI003B9FFD19